MPFKIPDEQKRFKFALSPAGLPLADVDRMGAVFWVMCCPLCGCVHDLSRLPTGTDEYTPACLLPRTHKTAYAVWVEKHSTAPAYTSVTLRYRGGHVIPFTSEPATVEKAA